MKACSDIQNIQTSKITEQNRNKNGTCNRHTRRQSSRREWWSTDGSVHLYELKQSTVKTCKKRSLYSASCIIHH